VALAPSAVWNTPLATSHAVAVVTLFPDVPIRQFVVTMPFPLKFPLALDGRLLGQVLRIFTDTVSTWYRKR
jgi:hypothetical protein